ncbi:MAG: formylglycine-generating enzyme family protein [Thermoguttaceae bacterium]|nr:formylglycine-generating enzyme family protein [Thermoguttaceae bacterium]
MTPIEEILKISQNLEQILENQYGAVGRGLREKVDSVANQLPEDTVRKIGKLAAMRNKATHENIALADEKIAAFRRIAGEVMVSLMLYRPFEATQTAAKSEDETRPASDYGKHTAVTQTAAKSEDESLAPQSPSQEPGPLWKEDEKFSWGAFYLKLFPDVKQYLDQRNLYDELLKDYSPTSRKVQETITQMRSAIGRLYGLYAETLQRRQMDLQTLIDDGCRSDSSLTLVAHKDIDKLKREMIQLQPDNSVQGYLKCPEIILIQELIQPGGIGKILTVDRIEYAFRWCPPGEFMMGSPNGYDCEKPHKVTLTRGFWLLETEVTVGMFKAFVSDTGYVSTGYTPWGYVNGSSKQDSQFSWRNPGFSQTDNHPVTNVSWNDAVEFCKWLGKKTGQNITLPTEAQWEYACRAGTTGDYAGDFWFGGNSNMTTHPVGTKKPNAWGLYDMHGNVWEWCSDYYDGEYYARSPKNDPENTESTEDFSRRVCRGGWWGANVVLCKSAKRNCASPDYRNYDTGLRVLLVPSQD